MKSTSDSPCLFRSFDAFERRMEDQGGSSVMPPPPSGRWSATGHHAPDRLTSVINRNTPRRIRQGCGVVGTASDATYEDVGERTSGTGHRTGIPGFRPDRFPVNGLAFWRIASVVRRRAVSPRTVGPGDPIPPCGPRRDPRSAFDRISGRCRRSPGWPRRGTRFVARSRRSSSRSGSSSRCRGGGR